MENNKGDDKKIENTMDISEIDTVSDGYANTKEVDEETVVKEKDEMQTTDIETKNPAKDNGDKESIEENSNIISSKPPEGVDTPTKDVDTPTKDLDEQLKDEDKPLANKDKLAEYEDKQKDDIIENQNLVESHIICRKLSEVEEKQQNDITEKENIVQSSIISREPLEDEAKQNADITGKESCDANSAIPNIPSEDDVTETEGIIESSIISNEQSEDEEKQENDITEKGDIIESSEISNKPSEDDDKQKDDIIETEEDSDKQKNDITETEVFIENNETSTKKSVDNDKEDASINESDGIVESTESNNDNDNLNNEGAQSGSKEPSDVTTVEESPKKETQKKDKKPCVEKKEKQNKTNKKARIQNKDNKNEENLDKSKEKENVNDNVETNKDKEEDINRKTVKKDVNEIASNELPITSGGTDVISNEQDLYNKRSDNLNDVSMDDENAIFVQVNNDKDDAEKSTSATTDPVSTDVDPIGSSDWSQNNESSENTFISDLDDADECIIPDTNRDESMSVDSPKEPGTTVSSTSHVATTSTENDRMKLSEKYLVSLANSEGQSNCMICKQKKVCKYNCSKDRDKTSLCSENCLAKLRELHTENVIVRQLRVKNFSLDKTLQSTNTVQATTQTTKVTISIFCKHCSAMIANIGNSLSWEALDFCNKQCLTRHQKLIGSYCANCRIEVKENFLGKYCVRFGYNVRQFCSSTCLEQYKKSSKVCSYCQDDISGSTSGFLTSIGDKGTSKDFCSAQCMQKYNEISKHYKGARIYEKCYVCHKHNVIEVEFDFKNEDVLFCSEPCFVAFKYVNDVNPEKCDMCCKYFVNKSTRTNYVIRYDGVFRKFCQKTCQNIYITTNRKIVSCCWCKVKKYNFDMIQKYSQDGSVLIVCSLTCLNFFNASINVSKVKRKRCDFCHKICKGQYHITLADDSMKNFCSYPCVQEYQNKYILAPARYTEQPHAMAANLGVRVTRKNSAIQQLQRKQIIPDVPGPLPIITSVRSLATPAVSLPNTRSLRSKSSTPNTINTITSLQAEPPPVKRVIILRPPDLAQQRNVATLVKPITADAQVEFKPVMIDKAVQTEDIKDSLVLVPIPVPIYVPSPMQMFNLVHPVPMPFPLPIPIPMFIPVTKQTANVVLKEIKKNQKDTPADPYEADLLMMAELVASENERKEKVEDSSDVNPESDADNGGAEPSFSPEPPDGTNTFGDDMLQMALKMATDFEEPAVDLEGALTASTITATPAPNEQVDDAPVQPPVERTTFRGRRRGRPPRHGGRGRGRGRPPTQPTETVVPVEPEPQPPSEPVEKPDANMCLKYTFGVNAWKQWVTTKNSDLEKSSRHAQSFKPDLLQLTSDELNYSLCLFVKEVRKPNGAEYAPDTIYYLCLGIQQYLYENGRIDNIFCDSYYESFTDCLDEVCKKFSTLYNDSQYIVTRVEEEHLWESKQLGAHSPHVLLSTLMFFNTKHFNLTNVEEHMQLSFSHIMKHWKRVPSQPGTPKSSSSRNILLRFYPPQSAVEGNNRKKKVYEQQENEENPLRCPVKLYEFYLSKCPESVKTRNDVFYLLPERSCVPDSPVWYSTMALGREPLEKMLHRVKMVKEINVALLAS